MASTGGPLDESATAARVETRYEGQEVGKATTHSGRNWDQCIIQVDQNPLSITLISTGKQGPIIGPYHPQSHGLASNLECIPAAVLVVSMGCMDIAHSLLKGLV